MQPRPKSSTTFRDGVAFVNLAPIAKPDLVLDTIAGALGLRDMGGESLRDRLIDVLADMRLLLVLDNFEQVVTAATAVARSPGACPGVTLLITSRISLRLSGEREFPIAPLPLHTSTAIEDAGLSGAVRLFTERAQAVRPDFRLTAETLPAVAEIVQPGRWAAAGDRTRRCAHESLAPGGAPGTAGTAIAAAQRRRADLPLRQQTMRDTIGWSYDLLNDAEQTLFRRLAVFVGGFTLGAAEAIGFGAADATGGRQPSTPFDVVEGITSLIEHSLLQQSPASADEPRYVMLETVREYALDRLDVSDEGDVIHRQHAAYFLAFVEAARREPVDMANNVDNRRPRLGGETKLTRAAPADWLNRLEADHDNLRAALDWLAHWGEPEAFLRLARSLSIFWLFRGPYEEGRAWLEQALARDGEISPLLRRDALYRARVCWPWPRAMLRGPSPASTRAWPWLGRMAIRQASRTVGSVSGWWRCSGASSARPPPISRRRWPGRGGWTTGCWPPVCAGLALCFLGALAYAQDALPLATSRFEAALREQRAIDDRWGMGVSLVRLGYAARDRGDDARAMALFAEGLALFTELGDRRIIALALDGVAGLAVAWGQPEHAARLFGAAAALREASGLPVDPAFRAAHGRDVAAARTALGEDAFAAGWATGAALPLPVAIAEATAIAAPAPGTVPTVSSVEPGGAARSDAARKRGPAPAG